MKHSAASWRAGPQWIWYLTPDKWWRSRKQHRDVYIDFVDLSKEFDTVDREFLWKVLEKCECPPRFTQIIREFHEGMKLQVRYEGHVSEASELSRGVKQGCVLAPVLFNISVQCITRMLSALLDRDRLISLIFCTDRSLFDLQKLKAKTKVSQTNLQRATVCRWLCAGSRFDAETPTRSKSGLKTFYRIRSQG